MRLSNRNWIDTERLTLTTSETYVPCLVVGWVLQSNFRYCLAKRYSADIEGTKVNVDVYQRDLFTNYEYGSVRRAAVVGGYCSDLDRASRRLN